MNDTKMNPTRMNHSVSAFISHPAIASLLLAGVFTTGCTHSERERYFEARAAVVMPSAGDGSARVALWPSMVSGRTALAAADLGSRTDVPSAPVLNLPVEAEPAR
jgi:hypothetical protein